VTSCQSCGATIFWAVSVNNSRMPINAEPVEDGNVLVSMSRSDPENKKCIVLAHDATKPQGRRLFTSHFSTCPNARKHRKKS
jgi:hypothetical protein